MKATQTSFLVRLSLRTFAIILSLGLLLRTFAISSFVMSGLSMMPGVWPGDFIVATKWGLKDLRRGEVVVLRCPGDTDQICLKRVVGLPGDRVEFLDRVLTLNGERAEGAEWDIWPAAAEPIVIPPHHLYLMNDKRDATEDSRTWGPIKSDLVEARAWRVWLSLDWFDGDQVRAWPRMRWERMFRGIN